MQKAILAVTTYNRRKNLETLVSSFIDTFHRGFDWTLIIADDGSTDATRDYLENLLIPQVPVLIIRNQRKGVHYQFNTIIRQLETMPFDICFKCDDDIAFAQPGWERLYIEAMRESGYQHLCFFDPHWRPEKNLNPPVRQGKVVSACPGKDVQGSFFTVTPQMVEQLGYMDVRNFGFRGVGHIDYTLRACRLGFNNFDHPFDAAGSTDFIKPQRHEYKTALPAELISGLEEAEATRRKYKIIQEHRTFIPFQEFDDTLDEKTENVYLTRAVRALEDQKQWYESEIQRLKEWEKEQYGHLPGWYLKIGKIFKVLTK